MPFETRKPGYSIQQVATLDGHADRVWAVAWNPVKSLIASCSADKTVRIWSFNDLQDNKMISQDDDFQFCTEIATGHRKTVRSIAWSPSGKTLATASFDSTVSIWEQDDAADWECVSSLEGHESECKAVAYSHDGALLASCSRDKSVWIWEGMFSPLEFFHYTYFAIF